MIIKRWHYTTERCNSAHDQWRRKQFDVVTKIMVVRFKNEVCSSLRTNIESIFCHLNNGLILPIIQFTKTNLKKKSQNLFSLNCDKMKSDHALSFPFNSKYCLNLRDKTIITTNWQCGERGNVYTHDRQSLLALFFGHSVVDLSGLPCPGQLKEWNAIICAWRIKSAVVLIFLWGKH